MKVLLWTRPSDGIGGDLLQVERTSKYLNLLGIDVIVKDNYRISQQELKQYDIIHLFVINMPNIEEKVESCIALMIPYVISPLYRDPKYGE